MRLEELEHLPWREVQDYLTYLQVTAREEEMQHNAAKGGSHGRR